MCMREEDYRPWGMYTVYADEADHKVKRIVVYPGKRLSLQRHQKRAEHWYVIQGEAVYTRFLPQNLYHITLDHAGGINIKVEPIPSILLDEMD